MTDKTEATHKHDKHEKAVPLDMLTARTLRDYMLSTASGKQCAELSDAIDKAEGKKKDPEPKAAEYK